MIKIITTIVCGMCAMLMLIISMATNYWLQWVIATHGQNITHYRGLAKHCWESVHNETGALIEENTGCGKYFEDAMPGK